MPKAEASLPSARERRLSCAMPCMESSMVSRNASKRSFCLRKNGFNFASLFFSDGFKITFSTVAGSLPRGACLGAATGLSLTGFAFAATGLGFALATGFAFTAGLETFFGAGFLFDIAFGACLEAGAAERFFGLA